jgi:hypothetical protein
MTHQEFAKFLRVKERLVHCLENEYKVPERTPVSHILRVSKEIEMSLRCIVYDGDRPELLAMAKAKELATFRVPVPRTRADCLTRERRTHLRIIGGVSPRRADDRQMDGVNCERPCPWVRCSHHTYLEVVGNSKKPRVEINFPEFGPEDMAELSPSELAEMAENRPDEFASLPRSRTVQSCSLDIAEHRRSSSLEEVGESLNLTPERIRQVGTVACAQVEAELCLDPRTLQF